MLCLGMYILAQGIVVIIYQRYNQTNLLQYKRLRSTLRRKDLRLGVGTRRPSDATSSDLFLNLMLADLIQAIGECLRNDNLLRFLIYVLRKLTGYQMDVSWGEILYCQLRHIFDNHQYEKAVLPGRLCNAQALFKQVGIVGVALTCVITSNYFLNESSG